MPPELVERIARAVAEQIRLMPPGSNSVLAVREYPDAPRNGRRLGHDGGQANASTNVTILDRLTRVPEAGYLRLKEVLTVIPVSRSTWYAGIKQGRYPKGTKKFGVGIAAWDVRDIRKLLSNDSE